MGRHLLILILLKGSKVHDHSVVPPVHAGYIGVPRYTESQSINPFESVGNLSYNSKRIQLTYMLYMSGSVLSALCSFPH
jgi:hypothetical protein